MTADRTTLIYLRVLTMEFGTKSVTTWSGSRTLLRSWGRLFVGCQHKSKQFVYFTLEAIFGIISSYTININVPYKRFLEKFIIKYEIKIYKSKLIKNITAQKS